MNEFTELMDRVRRGDEDAAEELVQQYEGHIRRVVRARLTQPALRRQFDSVDVCQSVLGDFFVRAALGQFDLNQPEQLVALLAKMAQNKLIQNVRKQKAQRRDVRRTAASPIEDHPLTADQETPSQIVAARELLDQSRQLLNEEERYLIDQRAEGRSWDDLAEELGAAPDALRMRTQRAVRRVAKKLKLESGE